MRFIFHGGTPELNLPSKKIFHCMISILVISLCIDLDDSYDLHYQIIDEPCIPIEDDYDNYLIIFSSYLYFFREVTFKVLEKVETEAHLDNLIKIALDIFEKSHDPSVLVLISRKDLS